MPKNPPQDKNSIPRNQGRPARRGLGLRSKAMPQSIGGIMQKGGWLQAARVQHDVQQDWLDWLRSALPEELRTAVVSVVPRGDALTVLAASASWGTRLRFALAP